MFSSLKKRLDDISLNQVDHEKIKSRINNVKNKIKKAVFRGSVARSIVATFGDIGSTYVNVNLYGINGENNLTAIDYMKKYGIGEGLLRENINDYIVPLYSLTLALYGSVKLVGAIFNHTRLGKKLNQNAQLFPDTFLDIYSSSRWVLVANNFGIMVSKQLPQPYNTISYFATSSALIIPMFYYVYKSLAKKISNK